MAALVLGVLGSMTPLGPVGGMIGSAIGGYIDQKLFGSGGKTPAVVGPRLTNLQITGASEGSPIRLRYGENTRDAADIIWSTGIRERRHKKRVKSGGKGGSKKQKIITYTYDASFAVLLAGNPGVRLKKILAQGKAIYDDDASPKFTLMAGVTFYPGDFSQMPDPLMEAALGVGEVSAYRGRCYIVVDTLQVTDWGGFPNLEFIMDSGPATAGAICRDVVARCGCVDYEAVATSLEVPVPGFVINQGVTGLAALQPLAVAYAFDAAEPHGQLRFTPRGFGPTCALDAGELGARSADSEPGEPISIDWSPPTDLPKQAVLIYRDRDTDLQPGTQTATRQFGAAKSNVSSEINVTLDADDAAKIAERMLWEPWMSRIPAKFAVSEAHRDLQPGHIVAVPVTHVANPRSPYFMRIARRTRTAEGVIEIEAVSDDPTIYRSEAVGVRVTVPENTVHPVGETHFVALDAPLLADADDDAGFYWMASAEAAGWRGADIQRSSDAGDTYETLDTVNLSGTMGLLTAPLGGAAASLWDRVNTIEVTLFDPANEIDSVTEQQVLNGQNYAWIGAADGAEGEIIQFADATLTAPGVYQISTLLRGLGGTEYAIGAHGGGEYFVLLDEGTLNRSDFGAADWNKARLYRPVSFLQDEDDVTPQAFTNTGESKRPLSAVRIRGSRDGSNNLTVEWDRRSRLRGPGLGNGSLPLGEEIEAYEIDIIVAGDVARTISTAAATASYPAADQATDGITPGNPVTLRVYQISTIRGRGRPGNATV